MILFCFKVALIYSAPYKLTVSHGGPMKITVEQTIWQIWFNVSSGNDSASFYFTIPEIDVASNTGSIKLEPSLAFEKTGVKTITNILKKTSCYS